MVLQGLILIIKFLREFVCFFFFVNTQFPAISAIRRDENVYRYAIPWIKISHEDLLVAMTAKIYIALF